MDYFLAHLQNIALRKISLLDVGHNGTEGRQIGELLLVELQLVKIFLEMGTFIFTIRHICFPG